jgi:hypothetical protein
MGIEFNKNMQRKVPINRNNLFYSDEDFNLDVEMGKNYIEEDMNQTVVLYQVDLTKTNSDALYGETDANQVVYKPPVEVHCVYEIEKPELKAYDSKKNLGTYVKTGKLTVGVYQSTLDELGVDMKKGDYLGVQVNPQHMEYFSIVNDGRNNYDNEHSMYGYQSFYRTVIAVPVDPAEFNG